METAFPQIRNLSQPMEWGFVGMVPSLQGDECPFSGIKPGPVLGRRRLLCTATALSEQYPHQHEHTESVRRAHGKRMLLCKWKRDHATNS